MSEVIKNKKKLQGKILSISGINTVKVLIESKYPHPKYGKIVQTHKKYLAHKPESFESAKVGDFVEITESRPISKRKTWIITNILKTL